MIKPRSKLFIFFIIFLSFWSLAPVLGALLIFPPVVALYFVGLPSAVIASFIFAFVFSITLFKTKYFHPPFDFWRCVVFGFALGLVSGVFGGFYGLAAGALLGVIMVPLLVRYWYGEPSSKNFLLKRTILVLYIGLGSVPLLLIVKKFIKHPDQAKEFILRSIGKTSSPLPLESLAPTPLVASTVVSAQSLPHAPVFTYAGINLGTDVAELKAKFPHSSQNIPAKGIYHVFVADQDSIENVYYIQLRVNKQNKRSMQMSFMDSTGAHKHLPPPCDVILGKLEKSFGVYQSSSTVWVGEGESWLKRNWFKDGESLTLECDETGKKAYSVVIE